MNITKFTIVTNLEGFIEALMYFESEEHPHINFEHSKRASPMQTIGGGIHYEYELEISSDPYPPINLYPVLQELEKRIDKL